jgi:hypothetical protein
MAGGLNDDVSIVCAGGVIVVGRFIVCVFGQQVRTVIDVKFEARCL